MTLENLIKERQRLSLETKENEARIKKFSEEFAKKYFKLLPDTHENTASMKNHIMQIARGNFDLEEIKNNIKIINFLLDKKTQVFQKEILDSCDIKEKNIWFLGNGNVSPVKTGLIEANNKGIRITNKEKAKIWLELMKELVDI